MTGTTQTSEVGPAGDKRGAMLQKSPSRKGAIALVTVVVALVLAPTLWGVHVALKLSRSPVSSVRPHYYEVALEEVLELQALALSEAEAGHEAFFVTHIGCAAPPVWRDPRVLENFKRMLEAGVEITIFAGLTGNKGHSLPSPDWPYELRDKLMETMKLKQEEVGGFYHLLKNELYNHSIVAGSARRAKAYIASHEETNIYPATYFTVTDNEACQEWKRNLIEKAKTLAKPKEDPS